MLVFMNIFNQIIQAVPVRHDRAVQQDCVHYKPTFYCTILNEALTFPSSLQSWFSSPRAPVNLVRSHHTLFVWLIDVLPFVVSNWSYLLSFDLLELFDSAFACLCPKIIRIFSSSSCGFSSISESGDFIFSFWLITWRKWRNTNFLLFSVCMKVKEKWQSECQK